RPASARNQEVPFPGIGIERYNAGIDVSLEPLKRVELRELPGPRARTAVLDSEVVARCRSPLAAFEFSSQSTTSSTMPYLSFVRRTSGSTTANSLAKMDVPAYRQWVSSKGI